MNGIFSQLTKQLIDQINLIDNENHYAALESSYKTYNCVIKYDALLMKDKILKTI